MDFKVVLSTFIAVFLAELGDKTQFLTFAASASAKSKLSVFIGSASALVLASAIGVLAGGVVGQVVSEKTLARIGGCIFLIIGGLTIFHSYK